MKTNAIAIISANYDLDGFAELTEKRAAATIPFGGRYRLIDFALSNIVNSGISSVGLITPYYYRSLMDHVKDGKPWGLAKKTGGLFILPGSVYGQRNKKGRYLLRDLINNRIFFEREAKDYVIFTGVTRVSNYDYSQFIESHAKSKAPVSLMYVDTENGPDDGIYLKLKKNGRVAQFRKAGEDSEHLFNGAMIIDREYLLNILDWYANLDHADLLDIFRDHLSEFDINAFKFEGYEMIIHDIRSYVKANMDLVKPEVRQQLFEGERKIMTKVQDEPPTLYGSGSSVKNSLVAAGCRIEGTVENSVIFRAVHVEKGAVIKNSIVMQHCTVKADAAIDNVVLDKNVTIESGVVLSGSKSKPAIIGKGRHF